MNPILQKLADQVEKNKQVEASAVLLIKGIAGRIADAVAKAIANGATAEELAPVSAEVDALKASADELGATVDANT